MKTLSITIFLLGLLAISCTDNPTSSRGKQFWPMTIGEAMVGTISEFDSTGAMTTSFSMSYFVSGDTIIENEKWYLVDIMYGDIDTAQVTYTELMTNRSDGLWADTYFDPNGNDADGIDPIFWLKYPAKAGDGYMTGDIDSIEVVSTASEVDVANKPLDCIEYYFVREPGLGDTRHYACPGIGLVKFDVQMPPSLAPSWTWQLDSIVFK